MTNSPLIDRKNRGSIRNYQRKIGKKKKDRVEKESLCRRENVAAAIVVAIGFCAANPVLQKELPLIGSVIERIAESCWGSGDSDRRNCNAGTNRARKKYNGGREEAGDNNTGATGIQSIETSVEAMNLSSIRYWIRSTHHYLDGLLCQTRQFSWG